MGKHQCAVPAAGPSTKSWTCPTCKTTWDFKPNAGTLSDLWHGRNNVRLRDGSKPKSWWS